MAGDAGPEKRAPGPGSSELRFHLRERVESAMSAGPCAPMSGHQSAGRAAGRSQSTGTFGHT